MAEITAELVSVERLLWSGKATIVMAQTTEGEIGRGGAARSSGAGAGCGPAPCVIGAAEDRRGP